MPGYPVGVSYGSISGNEDLDALWILARAGGSGSSNPYEIKTFGAVANYVSPSSRGTDNYADIQACITACGLAGGGTVLFSRGKYYTTRGWLIEWPHVVIEFEIGAEVYYHPTSAGTNRLFTFSANVSLGTTLVKCGIINPFLRGFDPDLIATANDHQMEAICTIGVSSFLLRNPDILYFNTGTANYVTEGPSVGCHLMGKELIRVEQCASGIGADLPYFIDKNPKEGIDCDTVHISDSYCTMPLYTDANAPGDQPAIKFAAGLNAPQFKLSGSGVFARGSGGILLDDFGAGSTHDVASFVIEQFRTEQQNNPAGWSIDIRKTGGAAMYDLEIRNANLNFESNGIRLRGTFHQPRINGGLYGRQMPQASSPQVLGLDFSTAVILDGKIDGFMIPKLGGGTNLYNFGALVVRNISGETPVVGRNQLFSIMMLTV